MGGTRMRMISRLLVGSGQSRMTTSENGMHAYAVIHYEYLTDSNS